MLQSKATLTLVVLALTSMLKVDGGLYVRWGRTKCPDDNVVVYTGYVATEYYTVTGGGHDYLCLSDTPQYDSQALNADLHSGLHGAEYWFGTDYTKNYPYSNENNNNQDINQKTAPCVMCYTPRTDVAMISGMRDCPGDLTPEYTGYIATNDFRETSSADFICIDRAPEVAKIDGNPKSGEARLMPVRVICGTLPCPNPYQGLKAVPCAVCSV